MEWIPVLAYLLVAAGLTALGAPLSAALFEHLPRRGAAFALPAAMVPFAIVVFWIGQLTFGLHTLLLGIVAVLVLTAAAWRLDARPDWRGVAAAYGVFVVGFLFMLSFRAANPAITPQGGEQFLHFALVNTLERAESLPPEDVWFAGRPLKYYYGTQMQVASLSMLTGTAIRYGFNLGIATFYGMLFVVAYGVGGAVVQRRGGSFRVGGAFGAFFVALGGASTTAIRLLTPYLPEFVSGTVEQAAFGFVAQRFNGGDLATTVSELSAPFDWSWWYTRYVVPGTIQEVPLYSFVKADLHGHTFANPYVLFAGALALAYYVTPESERKRRLALVFGGLGAVAGLFGFMNTWSLPTAAGMAMLAVGAADAHPSTLLPDAWGERLRPAEPPEDRMEWIGYELWRVVLAAVVGAVVLLIGIVVASPFLVFGHVPSNEGIGFLPPRSPLPAFLVLYGGLLTAFAVSLAVQGREAVEALPGEWLGAAGLLLVGAVAFAALFENAAVLALLGTLVVAGWLLVRSGRAGFATVLLIAGAGLLLALELAHAKLPLIANPRWNTSLKVAVQAWTLGAAGAGAASALLLGEYGGRLRDALQAQYEPNRDSAPANRSVLSSALVVVLVVAVLLISATFPVMMFAAEVGDPIERGYYEPSLDGWKAVENYHPDEYEALRWLKDRPGKPTIVEAPGSSYGWSNPASTFSGLPTIVGWDHEAEYRSQQAYERRVGYVEDIYTGEWERAAILLDYYDVRYVYVGPNEREAYDDMRSFDREAFSVAFESDAVTVYEVDQSTLPYDGDGDA
jgi:YYY domain-containing protein